MAAGRLDSMNSTQAQDQGEAEERTPLLCVSVFAPCLCPQMSSDICFIQVQDSRPTQTSS